MMTITSFWFFVFLGITALFYYIIFPKKQWQILLTASIAFYIFANGLGHNTKLLPYIFITSFSIWYGAIMMRKSSRKDLWFYGILLLNLGFLSYFKYWDFFISLFDVNHQWGNLIMPIGISFYTFQTIGYFINVKWKTTKVQKNYWKLLLFTSFFPTCMQGPIHKYEDLAPQLFGTHKFNWKHFCFGMQRILWGLFKKLVIADRLAIFVNPVFADPQYNAGWIMVIGVIGFAIQLYSDFSGCMDIVIGAGEMFGIKMTENFRSPYFSRSIPEYWQRWHITLGIWLKEYILYPTLKSNWLQKVGRLNRDIFGKKLGNKVQTYTGLFVLWSSVGFWHGGSWNYIIGSGLLHWFYICFGDATLQFRKKITKHFNTECISFQLMQILRTFTLVCIGFIFFRTRTMTDAGNVFQSIFSENNWWIIFDGSLLEYMGKQDWTLVLNAILVLLIVDILRLKGSLREKIAKLDIVSRWFIYFIAIFSILIFGIYGPGYDATKFIYGAF